MPHTIDLNVQPREISQLASADAVAAFLSKLGYDTSRRAALTPESVGLAGESAAAIRHIEKLADDEDGDLQVIFVQLRSLTARSRNDLARVLGKSISYHLLILTADFSALEFVLLDKRKREYRGPGGGERVYVVPISITIDRKAPNRLDLRAVRRLTWTCRDGLDQYLKLQRVFESAAFAEEYFQNRGLFSDYYLTERLRHDPAWRENPAEPFRAMSDRLKNAHSDWHEKGEAIVREQLYKPAFKLLGFSPVVSKQAGDDLTTPDYVLQDGDGRTASAAFVYSWERWLDGPDYNDQETPEENPGACVVSALDRGEADWIIVTNGRLWRLYSRQSHSPATNYYEVDLVEALAAANDSDPNEAFRYWWLFFRRQAFDLVEAPTPAGDGQPEAGAASCWLDRLVEESRDYAKQLGERLKNRIFVEIFPHLAAGFLEHRRSRLGVKKPPSEEELRDIFEATLTLLYRLLFLLFAESRDLLPVREGAYLQASLKRVKEAIADEAGPAESEVAERLKGAYSTGEYKLYDDLQVLFRAMDHGDPSLNVPVYNGGLFITTPSDGEQREQRIARFLHEYKVPDRFLALAIDRLARDPDDKTLALVFIDYKSLEVRHLGSIYEGLLEFKLKIADEDLATRTEKGREKYVPLGQARGRSRRAEPPVVVRKGDVYLSNDKAERKASGSYYTPDSIVKYIVRETVGPVLDEKLEALRREFRKVRKTYDREREKATAWPVKKPSGEDWDPREFALEKVYATHKDLVERLFDFRVLDPAMGSGHFLVEAVDFIANRLIDFLNPFPINPVRVHLEKTRQNIVEALAEQRVSLDPDKLNEVTLLKRHVLKRCIYGVDLNPMAVELAKVSLWLGDRVPGGVLRLSRRRSATLKTQGRDCRWFGRLRRGCGEPAIRAAGDDQAAQGLPEDVLPERLSLAPYGGVNFSRKRPIDGIALRNAAAVDWAVMTPVVRMNVAVPDSNRPTISIWFRWTF